MSEFKYSIWCEETSENPSIETPEERYFIHIADRLLTALRKNILHYHQLAVDHYLKSGPGCFLFFVTNLRDSYEKPGQSTTLTYNSLVEINKVLGRNNPHYRRFVENLQRYDPKSGFMVVIMGIPKPDIFEPTYTKLAYVGEEQIDPTEPPQKLKLVFKSCPHCQKFISKDRKKRSRCRRCKLEYCCRECRKAAEKDHRMNHCGKRERTYSIDGSSLVTRQDSGPDLLTHLIGKMHAQLAIVDEGLSCSSPRGGSDWSSVSSSTSSTPRSMSSSLNASYNALSANALTPRAVSPTPDHTQYENSHTQYENSENNIDAIVEDGAKTCEPTPRTFRAYSNPDNEVTHLFNAQKQKTPRPVTPRSRTNSLSVPNSPAASFRPPPVSPKTSPNNNSSRRTLSRSSGHRPRRLSGNSLHLQAVSPRSPRHNLSLFSPRRGGSMRQVRIVSPRPEDVRSLSPICDPDLAGSFQKHSEVGVSFF